MSNNVPDFEFNSSFDDETRSEALERLEEQRSIFAEHDLKMRLAKQAESAGDNMTSTQNATSENPIVNNSTDSIVGLNDTSSTILETASNVIGSLPASTLPILGLLFTLPFTWRRLHSGYMSGHARWLRMMAPARTTISVTSYPWYTVSHWTRGTVTTTTTIPANIRTINRGGVASRHYHMAMTLSGLGIFSLLHARNQDSTSKRSIMDLISKKNVNEDLKFNQKHSSPLLLFLSQTQILSFNDFITNYGFAIIVFIPALGFICLTLNLLYNIILIIIVQSYGKFDDSKYKFILIVNSLKYLNELASEDNVLANFTRMLKFMLFMSFVWLFVGLYLCSSFY
ncbi:hypothetical protein GCM10010211_65180 [Streptomyces albospinus]|uniref:Uncharacterized protein n=1 Tax=Streptomyces albospinus TaxID=285515 RepID=A0ABQ2VLX0_9ACTN|nr:hypothetical protein GCM10010211_65180 [Streptomyces albospinus]